MAINSVVLVGRLTKDPELRATLVSGANVCSFTLAVDDYNGKEKTAHFIECVAWEQPAKFLCAYCKKGSLVGLTGKLTQRSYDRKDGTKSYVIEVLVANLQSFDSKGNSNETIKDYTEPAKSVDNLEFDSFSDLPF